MMFPLPPGERRRTFLALSALAFVGVAALVAAMLVRPSHAEVLAVPGSNSGWSICNFGVCQWGTGTLPTARIIHVPQPTNPDEIAARDARIKQWEIECGVGYARDKYGVMHYTYNTPGCEFGSHP